MSKIESQATAEGKGNPFNLPADLFLDVNLQIKLGLRLRSKSHLEVDKMVQIMSETPPLERAYLSLNEFKEKFSTLPGDLEKIIDFASKFSLTIEKSDLLSRMVLLSGKVSEFNQAFNIKLRKPKEGINTWHGHVENISLPNAISPIITSVFGLKGIDKGQKSLKSHGFTLPKAKIDIHTVPEVTELYNFPPEQGDGQNIALIEMGGGYNPNDIKKYFGSLGMAVPKIVLLPINGSKMKTGLSNAMGQLEFTSDLDILGSAAPKSTLVVYHNDAAASELSFSWSYLETFSTILLDEAHQCKVISTSWSDIEEKFSEQIMLEINQICAEASLLGITICASSGDFGSQVISGKNEQNQRATVHFPASSPFVLSCGGSYLYSNPEHTQIEKETTWNEPNATLFWVKKYDLATGGGISNVFDLPFYQEKKGIPLSVNPSHRRGRGLPDVAANAALSTGYKIYLWGFPMCGVGGTSLATPIWAALIARINQALGKPVGFLNPILYQELANQQVLRHISGGNNHLAGQNTSLYYEGKAGWNACTGWGSPDGKRLLAAIRNANGKAEAETK